MTRRASPRLAAYGALCAVALVAALAGRRPEVAALAAPFALVLAAAALADRPPRVHARVTLARDRALEGEEIDATLTLHSVTGAARVEAYVVLPPTVIVTAGTLPSSCRLLADEDERVRLRLLGTRWGSHRLGTVVLRTHDPLGLFAWEGTAGQAEPLRVYPRPETLRRLVSPLATQAPIGTQVAHAKGDGLEFADLRPFTPGDRVRSVNWRASARRGDLVVNERHPERNTDVVVFLDTFVDARHEQASTLDRAVRATSTLASHYLERRNRVGLVALGGTLRWLQPGSGLVQGYRLIDALLETEVVFTYAWKDANIIPARTLPPRALIVAVTPLLDPRGIAALLDLRSRGRDLVVVEVSPFDLVEPGPTDDDRLAYRLWRLRREELVSGFSRLGVAVARWDGIESLAPRLEEVTAFRRHAKARAAVAAALGAVAFAAWLAAWPALLSHGDRARLLLSIGVAGAVAVGLATALARSLPLTAGIVLLGGGYALELVLDQPPLDARAALVGAGLLLTAELGHWSIELRREVTHEPGRHLRRLAAELALCVGGLLVAGLVLAAAAIGRVGGVAVEAAGALAAVALVWLAVAALRPPASGTPVPEDRAGL